MSTSETSMHELSPRFTLGLFLVKLCADSYLIGHQWSISFKVDPIGVWDCFAAWSLYEYFALAS